MSLTPTDDQDALDMGRLADGQDAALNDLMARHGERLFHYLIRQLQNETEAADLAQETFVRVYQNCKRYDPKQKFSTWLYTIATNLVRDQFRWRTRHPQVSLESEGEESGTALLDHLPDAQERPDQKAQTDERAEIVRKDVADLPEELRLPLVLAEYEGLSQLEIGAILSCSAKAVEMRVRRAREQLRGKLGKVMEAI
jgi:RNA polymerase sigma-70 factor (ECF subfamily)